MTDRWLYIDATTHEVASGPHAEEAPPAGEYAVLVITGWPERFTWSAGLRGFVEVPVSPLMSIGRFKLLFTFAERAALRQAAAANAQIEDFMDLLNGFTEGVSLTDPVLVGGIGALQQAGLLTAARAAAVLAGMPPE